MVSLRTFFAVACVLAASLTAACSTFRPAPAPALGRDGAAAQEGLEELEPQALNSGACSMFLWSQSAARPVFVFVGVAAEARVRRNGRDRILRRTAAGGQSWYGFFESQTFSDDLMSIETDLQFSTTRQLRDGAVIDGGVIRVRDRQGWETIVPVNGMVACQR